MVMANEADEALLLDLLNSRPIVDGVEHDRLGDPAAGRTWLAGHGHAPTEAEWQGAVEAREKLRSVVRGEASPAVLDALLVGVGYRPAASEHGIRWTLDAPEGRAVAARAVLAWGALQEGSPGRLRACANPECALFLIDRSKANSARWCSMAICGNRMKARRHYQRTRRSDA
jgi:predicted RNA-binding Zn ribbon-like protein